MPSFIRVLVRIVTCAALLGAQSGCSGSLGAGGVPDAGGRDHAQSVRAFPIVDAEFPISLRAIPVCLVQADVQSLQCTAERRTDIVPNPSKSLAAILIPGYHPSDLDAAYGLGTLPRTAGRGATIAIVVAYHTLNLEADLNVYRAAFGLGPCTVADGCLTIDQMSPVDILHADPNWRIEASVDAETASALCPLCKIYVEEANSAKVADLAAAVDRAAGIATVVNNSFAMPESPGAVAYESHWNHPGVPIVAGAGDGGYAYGVSFPASSRYVTAVGGTTLTRAANGAFTSSVWPLSGSGCSAYIPKPAWQKDTGCPNRTDNDVAAVADPNTGVAAFVTEAGGWAVFGGTSVATPVISAIYALTGNAQARNGAAALYARPQLQIPVTTGNNGTCSPAYLCTAGAGYNGPGGLGTPFL